MPLTPGTDLLHLCSASSSEVFLVAPFIKTVALKRLLKNLTATAALKCVTRWHSEEIASGVCDLEVFNIVSDHGGSLWLRQDLHAKYYRGDSIVFVGSANLTDSGLGWSAMPNFELLIPVQLPDNVVSEFEHKLFESAVQVDQDLYEMFQRVASDWNSDCKPPISSIYSASMSTAPVPLIDWIPGLRNPSDLFKIYQSDFVDNMPITTRTVGESDLLILRPLPGLNLDEFNKTIGATLLTTPIFNSVDRFISDSRRFGEVRNFLQNQLVLEYHDATRAWQTIIRWLRHFLPERYEYIRPNYSEIIVRKS